jgi:hypothetical protein
MNNHESNEAWKTMDLVLSSFGTESYDSTIDQLSRLEEQSSDTVILTDFESESHFRLWVQIQSAAVSESTGHLHIAEQLLCSIRENLSEDPFLEESNIQSCHCLEWSSATLLLSRVKTAQGKLESAVNILEELFWYLNNSPFHVEVSTFEEVESHRNYCLELLGHDENLLALHPAATERVFADIDEHWHPQVPIYGQKFLDFKERCWKLRQRYEDLGEEDLQSKHGALERLLSGVRDWSAQFPTATLPKRLTTIYALWKARIEIDREMFSEFEHSLELGQAYLEELTDLTSDCQLDFLVIVRTLLPLATEVAFHDYSNETVRARYFPIGYGCIATSKNLLDDVFENWPVSPASAIVMSLYSDTASAIYEILGRYPEAIAEMNRSVAIVDELLVRDPSNDRGRRLKLAYDQALRSSNVEIAVEVHSWNWLEGE